MAAFSATAGFGRTAGARAAGRRSRASLASRIPITALAVVALSTGLLRARAADPTGQLRLLVPLETGSEHGQLVKLFPEAEVVKRDGRNYLMLGTYSDARQAYRAGRRMQQSLPLRFVITYPVNHPQANGRWIAAEEAAEAAASRQAAQRSLATRAQQQQDAGRDAQRAAAQARAAHLGPTLQASNPILASGTAVAEAPVPTAPAPAQSPAPAEPAAPTPAPARPQAQAQDPVLVAALNPRGLLEPQATPEPVAVATPEPQATPEPAPKPEPVRAVVATPRPQEQEAPAPEPAWVRKPEASAGGQGEQPPLVALASPPLSRRRLNLLATNPELVYVFAELASRDDVDCLQQRMPVSDVVERDGKLLAQVGIYTTSRTGRVLRRQLEEQLRADGIQVVRMGAS